MNAEQARAIFSYDAETGILSWKEPPHPRFRRGDEAGTIHRSGYRIVECNARRFPAHRIIWLIVTGAPVPHGLMIDHRDGNRADNRWANLRLATNALNQANAKRRKGKALPKGVSTHCKRDRVVAYRAYITVGGATRFLGLFETPDEAHAAYCWAAEQAYGEFARAA